MPKTTVVIADLSQETLAGAFDAIFAPFGGVEAVLPMNPAVSAWLLFQARLHGLTARVPPSLG